MEADSDREPALKIKKTEVPSAVQSNDRVRIGKDFFNRLVDLKAALQVQERQFSSVLGIDELDIPEYIEKHHLLELSKGRISDENAEAFQRLFDTVVETQRTLIDEVFEFMQEAATLLGISQSFRKKDALVLDIAHKLRKEITVKELRRYAAEVQEFCLCLLKKEEPPTTGWPTDSPQAKLESYVELGKRIRKDQEARSFIDGLWKEFQQVERKWTFNALCVPSGTGKSQLAFALPDDCLVLYMNLSVRMREGHLDGLNQPIYENFRPFMWFVWDKLVNEDYQQDIDAGQNPGALDSVPYWIYGVVSALLELLQTETDLQFPQDMARVVITDDPRQHQEAQVRILIQPTLLSDVLDEIAQVQTKRKQTLLFFLDEFTALNGDEQKKLAFLRRRFMNLNTRLVVASTDSGAVNMLNHGAATPASRGGEKAWVRLFTQLPRYVVVEELRTAIHTLSNDPRDANLGKLFDLCLTSRPLFARTVEPLIDQSLAQMKSAGSLNQAAVVALVEEMREVVLQVMSYKSAAFEQTGCYGYLVAMLSAGYCRLVRTDEKRAKIIANLSTKNWAYLVSEAHLVAAGDLSGKGENRKKEAEANWAGLGQLSGAEELEQVALSDESETGEFEPSDPAITEEFQLEMKVKEGDGELYPVTDACKSDSTLLLYRREKSVKNSKEELYYKVGSGNFNFVGATFFPDPSDDFLLYLVLAGSIKVPGLYVDFETSEKRGRISASTLINRVLGEPRPTLVKSANALMPDWERYEMRVAAAFMAACNAGPITGVKLEELVTRFVAELIDHENEFYFNLKTLVPIKWNGKFTSQFMWPYDTEIAGEVSAIFGVVHSTRPPNSMKFDAGAFERNDALTKKLKLIIEVKSSTETHCDRRQIQAALHRQDSLAKVSFVVVNNSIKNLKNFRLRDFKTLNRGTRDGNKFEKGPDLRFARLFKVRIEPDRRVVVDALDGRTSEHATRLIFLISLADINSEAGQVVK